MDSPVILYEDQLNEDTLKKIKENKLWLQKDIYESQLTELFEILNADLISTEIFDEKLREYLAETCQPSVAMSGNYVYYPWSGLLLHMVSKDNLRRLRTNRTNHLITQEEQVILSQFTAGVAGLSFGNGIALSLVYTGISDHIKIADSDIFETTNLNRVRVGLPNVTESKTSVTAREIYEINPYAKIDVFGEGLNDDNLDEFLQGNQKLNIIFDVVDDLSMKIKLRVAAKKAKIPVIMLTSLEDSILVDVERFDADPDLDIFHGLLGDVVDDLLTKEMSEEEKAKYAMAIVGPQNVSYRNLLSLSDVGRKLVSRPHLYGTVSIVCGLASYIAKRIALGESMPSMRKLVKFNEVLDISSNKDDTPEAREEILSRLLGKK